jgi:hypothetical protein
LSEYIRNLHDWVEDKIPRNDYVGGLISSRGYSDIERREFSLGREGLWKLMPPITLEEIQQAELPPAALIALGLALVLQARHALQIVEERPFEGVPPEPIPTIERQIRAVSNDLESAGRQSKRGAIARMKVLRGNLQELRARLADRARDEEGVTVDDSASVQEGRATARLELTGTLGERIRGLLPGRMNTITQPGSLWKAISARWVALLGLDDEPSWEVVPEVPEPMGLYLYLAELDHWAASEPLGEPFLVGLLQILKYGEPELQEYRAGRAGLWGLVPPIDATQVADANLDKAAAAALGLGVVVWGFHGLARYTPSPTSDLPPMLQEAAEIIAALSLVLAIEGEDSGAVVSPSLYRLGLDLEARGVNALSALGDRRAAIVEAHRAEVVAHREVEAHKYDMTLTPRSAEAMRDARRIPGGRLVAAGLLLIASILFVVLYPTGRSKIPPAASYRELPARAIIRHEDKIIVRVQGGWIDRPAKERAASAVALWKRFVDDIDDPSVDLLLRDLANQPLGRIHLGEVSWTAPDPAETDEGPGEEEEEEEEEEASPKAAEEP